MVISLKRHLSRENARSKSPASKQRNFCQQQYQWINISKISSSNPKQYRLFGENDSLFPNFDSSSPCSSSCSPNASEIFSTKIVLKGVHKPTDHQVAIKVIDLEGEESLEDSVVHEIRIIAGLRHSNLVPLLNSFVVEHYLWNVYALAHYGSVDQWSRPNGLSEMAIALIIRDVLTALNYLHKKGIIHRAVCGSHILINSLGNCMLTGLKYSTTVLQQGRWQHVIHQYPKNCINILNHLAPEVLEQNMLGYNSKSDIYSIGIVCCELANGCIPFEDVALTEMLLCKLTGNFPRPLDSTCDEIQNFPADFDDFTPDVQEKYNIYKNRTFSSHFHTFTIQLCLQFDIYSRPTATQLLNHAFIKQTKKSNQNLIELLNSGSSKTSSRSTCDDIKNRFIKKIDSSQIEISTTFKNNNNIGYTNQLLQNFHDLEKQQLRTSSTLPKNDEWSF